MKSICTLLLVLFSFLSVALAQTAPPARTDVYHVNFSKAALGKAGALGDFLKTPNPNSPMPQHFLVLRHQDVAGGIGVYACGTEHFFHFGAMSGSGAIDGGYIN